MSQFIIVYIPDLLTVLKLCSHKNTRAYCACVCLSLTLSLPDILNTVFHHKDLYICKKTFVYVHSLFLIRGALTGGERHEQNHHKKKKCLHSF